MDLAQATSPEVRQWSKDYRLAGDKQMVECLRSLINAIETDNLPLRIEAEGWIFDILVLKRGYGL